MNKQINKTLVWATEHEEGYPPTSAMEFKRWLDSHLTSIPLSERDTTILAFTATGVPYSCGDSKVQVELSYRRMETECEKNTRETQEQTRLSDKEKRREDYDRAEYLRLRAKYNGDG